MSTKKHITNTKAALEEALEDFTQKQLAEEISKHSDKEITQPYISRWLNDMGKVPAEYVIAFEAATKIPRHKVRPDLYPKD